MNFSRHQLFAGAGLAQNQDTRLGASHERNLLQHLLEARLRTANVAESLRLGNLFAEVFVLQLQSVFELFNLFKCTGVDDGDGGLVGKQPKPTKIDLAQRGSAENG